MAAPKSFQSNHGVVALAREVSQSVTTVSRKLKAGKTPDDVRAEAKAWQEKQAKEDAASPSESLTAAKTRKESYLADLRCLELQVMKGELVNREDVERDGFRTARVIRDSLLSIPDRICAIVAAETDAVKVHAIFTEEIRKALESLADKLVEETASV